MHSCRHAYPTSAFQLLFPPAAVTLMGHWSVKADNMSVVYDGHRTATELAYKHCVAKNIRSGWRPVGEGCVLTPPLFPLSGTQPVPRQVPVASDGAAAADADVEDFTVISNASEF